jgi:hypothetical protein
MATDGYSDQFGGEKNRKFLVHQFEKMIENIDTHNTNPQDIITNSFLQWKGEHLQTDDVLVAGFKI